MASNPRAKASAQRLLIAADVGGTHARLALVGIAADGHVEILQHEKYACAAFAGLADIVEAFRRAAGAESVDEIAMACAGFVVEGEVVNENLPWLVSVPQLRERLRSTHLAVVNDFKALAYAVADARDALVTLQRGVATDGTLPSVAIGPGTGLGSAVCIPQRGAMVVLATEAGHAQLTPGSELELDLLREFRRSEAYVKTEHALSGPGLVNLHRALARLHGVAPVFDTPAAISTAAHRGDATALDTVRVFCGWLGSVVTWPAACCRSWVTCSPTATSSRASSTRGRCARRSSAYRCAWSSTVSSASPVPRSGTCSTRVSDTCTRSQGGCAPATTCGKRGAAERSGTKW